MIYHLHQHTKKKYNTLYQRVAKAIENGRFATYTKAKRKALKERLYRYENRLQHWGIAVASAAALFVAPITAKGQITFTPQTGLNNPFEVFAPNNPFDGVDVGSSSSPSFADIDGDGDFDAFIGGLDGLIKYFENTGSSSSPIFEERTGGSNPLGSVDVGFFSSPSFADIDGDGDKDAFIGEYSGAIKYYENTGSSSSPSFEERTGSSNPLSSVNVGYNSTPSFIDIDGDGDLDAFIGERDANINYYENTGSSSNPIFEERTGSSNPLNVGVGNEGQPSFADIDRDGDFDAFIGGLDGLIKYFENTGSSSSPSFVERTGSSNPFDGVDVGYRSTPSFVDIDGDEDMDAFIGENDGTIKYFENTGSSSSPSFVGQVAVVASRSSPSFVDIDGDGDFDAFIGGLDGLIKYFENTGSSSSPSFVERTGSSNPFNGVDVGDFSTPTFVDIDGDGDLDAFIGERFGTIKYYENTGSSSSPSFSERTGSSNPLNSVSVGRNSTPSFVDVNGDGDLDAFIGENAGNINYYENTGSSSSPSFVERTGSSNPFNSVAVGIRSTPSFVDIDGDGDMDAFIGENDGNINYFENTGSSSSPSFVARTGSSNPFDGVDVGNDSTPSFADIDGDGDMDAFIGEYDGFINYFRNDSPIVPVELITFTAKATQAGNQLFWATASELNNEGFHIERSLDGKVWKRLGFVAGNGTTLEAQTYTFLDVQPAAGINYYRLQQVDFDGAFEYSDIVAVNFELGGVKDELQVYPNPASGIFQIALPQANAKLQLYNAQGSLVKEVIAADKNFTINIADLVSGIYLLKAQAGEQVWMQRVVVE